MPRIISTQYIRSIVLLLPALLAAWGSAAQVVCTDDLTENNWNNSWVSCRKLASPNPERPKSHWLLFEFDELQSIDMAHIWNANRQGESPLGVKEAIIDYSVDGNTWTNLGTFTFPKGTEKADYQGFQGPDFGGIFLTKILFTVTQTHGDPGCASLAEVQFNINREACYGQVDACGNCNGSGQTTWYIDQDGDGSGDAANAIQSCEQPLGYVSNADDECDTGVVGWAIVGPIFEENGCTGCHGNGSAGGLNLTSYETAVRGGRKCGTGILTGTTLIDIIMTDMYAGCGSPFIGPSMNDRVGGNIDANELALIRKWIEDGAPEDCSCPTGSPDTDQDGFCDAIDQCPDIDNDLIGTPCDDGSTCTTQDIWQADCNCRGTLIDRDGDGVCDTEDLAPNNPCTADGIVDGIEPEDWKPQSSNDCDQDKITVASGDLNDFSACVDKVGPVMTAECNCGNNTITEGGIVTDFSGMSMNEARSAGGVPDGLFSGNISNNADTLILQFPFMETGEEICLTVGFSAGNGRMRIFLNNRLMTYTGEQALNNYQPQEFCFQALNTGVQTLMITEDGPGEMRVDGTTYSACPCDGPDEQNVVCLANFAGVGWRQLNDCSLEICEGQPLILGTDRYETLIYQWKGPNGLSLESPTLSFESLKPSDSGIYWLYAQSNSGCDLIKLIELNVLAAPPVSSRMKHPACGLQNGEIALSFTDTPGRSNIQFSIDGENGNYVTVADNLERYVYSNLRAGSYEVWARWGEGDCPVLLRTFLLEDQPIPTAELGPNLVICEGQSVTLSTAATGKGLTYSWSNGKTSASQKVTPIPDLYADQTFTYRVTVTDENACTVKDRVNVTVKSRPKVLVDLAHPSGGLANGAIHFRFADHPGHMAMGISLTGEQGNYQQVPDDKGKFSIKNLPVSSHDVWIRWEDGTCPVPVGLIQLRENASCPEIVAGISSNLICEGEAVTLSVTKISGATYAWSNGATTATQTVTPVLSTYANQDFYYAVTVTDRYGCSRVGAQTVKVLSKPQVTISKTDAHCSKADGTITFKFKDHPHQTYMKFSINGAGGPYYRVDDTKASYMFSKLQAGRYDLWVRWNNERCPTSLGIIDLNNISGPQINAGPDLVVCEGDPIRLNVNRGKNWSYRWSNGVEKPSQSLTVSARPYENRSLIYTVTVTDEFGCKATDQVIAELRSNPRATFSIKQPTCGRADGAITFAFRDHKHQTQMEFSITGSKGTYKKVEDKAGSYTFSKLPAGKYYAWVRWADDSCPVNLGSIILEDVPGPQINAGPDLVVCEGTAVNLNVNRNKNWTYSWNNGVRTPDQTLLLNARAYEHLVRTYTVRVTDQNNCAAVDDVSVTVLSKPRATTVLTHPTCGKADGAITFQFKDHANEAYMEFSINGAEGPYIRKRDDLGSYTISKLPAGVYELWIRWRSTNCPVKLGKVRLVESGTCNTGNLAANQEEADTQTIRPDTATDEFDQEQLRQNNIRKYDPEQALKSNPGSFDLQLYPNPALRGSTITIRYFAPEVGKPLKIVDPTGRIIRQIDADMLHKGWNELQVELKDLSTGSYFVVDGYGNYKIFAIIQ